MAQTTVKAIWHSDIDEVAHSLSYGIVGDDWEEWVARINVSNYDDEYRAAQFAAARAKWNNWVNRLARGGYLTKSEENNLRYCRYPGVILNQPVPKYACRHVCCPYCHYRWTADLLRKHRWLMADYLDLVAWQVEIPRDTLLSRIDRTNVINYPVKENRKLLKRILSPGLGLSVCRLWIDELTPVDKYFAQILFIGQGLRRNVSEVVSNLSDFVWPEHIQTKFGANRDVVLSVFRFNRSYLRVPGKFIEPLRAWRKRFQVDKLKNEA